MREYRIIRADFSTWKRLVYRALAVEALERDSLSGIGPLYLIEIGG